MSEINKKIQYGEVSFDKKGNKKFVLSPLNQNFLFQTKLPRMPEYKIMKLKPEKAIGPAVCNCSKSPEAYENLKRIVDRDGNPISLSEISKDFIDELGYDPYVSCEREKDRKDDNENLYIVDEVGELFERAGGKDEVYEDSKMQKEFFALVNKVQFFDPLNFDTDMKTNLFYDVMELDINDNDAIIKFCNEYGLLYQETFYFGNESNRDQQVLIWELVPDDNTEQSYRSGKLSLNRFCREISIYQNTSRLWCTCISLGGIKSLTKNQRNGKELSKPKKEQIKLEFLKEVDTLDKLYYSGFSKRIKLPEVYKSTKDKITGDDEDKKKIKPLVDQLKKIKIEANQIRAIHFAVDRIKIDIIKKINYYIFSVRPEIYLEEKDGKAFYRYRFLYRDLLEALYLILFNYVTDNRLRFYICKQCGKINPLMDGRGGAEYCPRIGSKDNKMKGSSDCKRKAEENYKIIKNI